jgi:hypothetical protein
MNCGIMNCGIVNCASCEHLKDIHGDAGSLNDNWQNGIGLNGVTASGAEESGAAGAARMEQIPANLMTKCDGCGALLVTKDWLRDMKVCPRCSSTRVCPPGNAWECRRRTHVRRMGRESRRTRPVGVPNYRPSARRRKSRRT